MIEQKPNYRPNCRPNLSRDLFSNDCTHIGPHCYSNYLFANVCSICYTNSCSYHRLNYYSICQSNPSANSGPNFCSNPISNSGS